MTGLCTANLACSRRRRLREQGLYKMAKGLVVRSYVELNARGEKRTDPTDFTSIEITSWQNFYRMITLYHQNFSRASNLVRDLNNEISLGDRIVLHH